MKKIEAIIKPFKLEEVKDALGDLTTSLYDPSGNMTTSIDARGDRLFSLCGHQRHFLLSRGGGPPKLLVVGSQRRDLLIVEPLGEQAHHRMTGVAEAALPHLQLEGNVVPVLSAEVRDRRRLPSTVRSVTVDAAGNPFRRVASFGEPLTLGDESRACRVRQRQERRRGTTFPSS